jgi:hypothetical protein
LNHGGGAIDKKRRPARAAFFVHPDKPYKPVKGLARRHAKPSPDESYSFFTDSMTDRVRFAAAD